MGFDEGVHSRLVLRVSKSKGRPPLAGFLFEREAEGIDGAHAFPASVHERRNSNVRFSNRPFGVKRFQTMHQFSVDAARGLVLLFGIGSKALPSWGFEDEVEQSLGRPCR
jgi:hypothetical protein